MDASSREVEWEDGKVRDDSLDELVPSKPNLVVVGLLDAVKKLRGGDGRDRNGLLPDRFQQSRQVEPPSFGLDEDGCIENHFQGDRTRRSLRRPATMSRFISLASSASRCGISRQRASASRAADAESLALPQLDPPVAGL
jgi:hypothetical protein